MNILIDNKYYCVGHWCEDWKIPIDYEQDKCIRVQLYAQMLGLDQYE